MTKQALIDRLVRYAKVSTQSDHDSDTTPSTPGQWDLARLLVSELKELGMQDVTIDEHAYVFATLPANTDKDVPVVGFMAHIDTATDFTGENVQPVVREYAGGDIVLSEELGIVLSPTDFPEMNRYIGHTIITTDGTTLLGADDKAGIAIIMTAMEYLLAHPEIEHGAVRVAFTPDEEIGRGPAKFDVPRFGAKFAYTVDGGTIGELAYESFNAARAILVVKGKNVHPGSAKNKMVHSTKIAMEFHAALPALEAPEYTEGYEGFYHLTEMSGTVEETRMDYIIRDHDHAKFEARKAYVQAVAAHLADKYGAERIVLNVRDEYYNMREKIEPVREVVDIAAEAMQHFGITPTTEPIRGGTDGSQLSFKGLPTPNLFTGGENYHGRYEYVSADDMKKSAEVVVEIIKLFAAKA